MPKAGRITITVMKITLKIEKEFDITHLLVDAGVRYWEDASVNGEDDEDGGLIPCKNDDRWQPKINIETGVIENWEQGKTAEIHYKVCDDGIYSLVDSEGNVVVKIDGYVPNTMSPKENGCGDYIIMDINENGQIQDWEFDANDFVEDED